MKRFLIFTLSLGLSLFLTTLVTTFIPIGNVENIDEVKIYLSSNAIHTGLVLPASNKIINWKEFIDSKDFDPSVSSSKWIEMGWGDRRFYFEMPTWDHFTIGLAADALFLPDPAVMHVNYLAEHPATYPLISEVKISFKTYEKLVRAIQSWFVLQEGKPMLIKGKGYSGLDNFYEGKGSYSLLKTCNVWTSNILAEANLKHPLWSPTKYGLEWMWDIK